MKSFGRNSLRVLGSPLLNWNNPWLLFLQLSKESAMDDIIEHIKSLKTQLKVFYYHNLCW